VNIKNQGETYTRYSRARTAAGPVGASASVCQEEPRYPYRHLDLRVPAPRFVRHAGSANRSAHRELDPALAPSLKFGEMNRFRLIVVALLAIALAGYAVDCEATMSPEQASLCCKNMPCSSPGQDSQKCCKIMPSLHAPFVQTSAPDVSFSSVAVSIITVADDFSQVSSSIALPAQSHAPPILVLPSPAPIRV
jgi:hypothetical protein